MSATERLAVLAVAATAIGGTAGAATPPIELAGGSRVEFHEFDSAALGGTGEYSIFLPPSYDDGRSRYPVVYFLHGMFNDHTSWTSSRHGDLPATLEGLMKEGRLPEMILVHPNGGRSFYTNYRDGGPRYEDFVVDELVAHVETHYRVRTGRGARAIAGTSMGGYGALKIAMRHPDRYAAAAAHSPIVMPVRNPLDVPPEVRASRRFAFFSQVFAEIFGEPLDQAYYDANNPLVLAETARLDGLALYFDYGTADRYDGLVHIGEGLRRLDRILTERGVEHVFREHPGEPHGWALVLRHAAESLGFLAAHLQGDADAAALAGAPRRALGCE